MKNFFLILSIFLVSSVSVFAQSVDVNNQEQTKQVGKKQVGKFPMSAGGFLHLSVPVDIILKQKYDVGGGVGGTFKVNFFKWLALRTDLNYMYTPGITRTIRNPYLGGDISVKYNDYHALEIKELVVFQNETPLGKSGIMPWAGIGPAISLGTHNTIGIGFGAGLNYNLENNVYVGAAIDLTGYFGTTTGNDTFKFAVEAGYRF